ncbi:MAG: 3-deoxy-manno-octulosonate-8-phosphatase KdsC [Acidiferrobacterales bacterium]
MSAVAPPNTSQDSLHEIAMNIRLVLLDVDGVLTDGRLLIGEDGTESKAFNIRDGHGIKMLQQTGIEVGIITGRTSGSVKHRAADLKVKHLYQGREDKLSVLKELLAKLALQPTQAAFVGDDVVDLPAMLQVGLAVAVNDAHELVKEHAHWVTPSAGGHGAVREVCEMIMRAQGTYATTMQRYL